MRDFSMALSEYARVLARFSEIALFYDLWFFCESFMKYFQIEYVYLDVWEEGSRNSTRFDGIALHYIFCKKNREYVN